MSNGCASNSRYDVTGLRYDVTAAGENNNKPGYSGLMHDGVSHRVKVGDGEASDDVIERSVSGRVSCGNGRCLRQPDESREGDGVNGTYGRSEDLRAPMCASCLDEAESRFRVEEPSKTEPLLTADNTDRPPMNDSVYHSDENREDSGRRKPSVKAQAYNHDDKVVENLADTNLSTEDEKHEAAIALEKKTRTKAEKMGKITFACNLMLFVAKIVAVALSGSLVMISSLLDSAMDLLSGVIIWWSSRAIKKTNYLLYPKGRRKLEPVAIVMLAVIMSFVSLQLIHESVAKIVVYATHRYAQELDRIDQWTASFNLTVAADDWLEAEPMNASDWSLMASSVVGLKHQLRKCAKGQSAPVFETPTIIICAATIVVKFMLFIVCRRINNPSVQALAKDHFNDVISNTGTIALGIIGYKLWKYADPIGAIVISIWIIANWTVTAREQIRLLTGYTAKPGFIESVRQIAAQHDPWRIKQSSVIAFHFGSLYHVEIEILLSAEMCVREARDVSESLRLKLERLPEVERAFVHMDCKRDEEQARQETSQPSPEYAEEASQPALSTDQVLLQRSRHLSTVAESEGSEEPNSPAAIKLNRTEEKMMATPGHQRDKTQKNHVFFAIQLIARIN